MILKIKLLLFIQIEHILYMLVFYIKRSINWYIVFISNFLLIKKIKKIGIRLKHPPPHSKYSSFVTIKLSKIILFYWIMDYIWRPPSLSVLTPKKFSIKGVPGISVLNVCCEKTFNTLMPGSPLIEIFFGVNTLRLGGLQIKCRNFVRNINSLFSSQIEHVHTKRVK